MAKTPFSTANARFSDEGHKFAQRLIYPIHFKVEQSELGFETTKVGGTTRASLLDGEMAIDRIVTVRKQTSTLRIPMRYTVQERFRDVKWLMKQDITITEWNHLSSLGSELYKMFASLFVYGYMSFDRRGFADWIVCDGPAVLRHIVEETIPFTVPPWNTRSKQTFRCYLFTDLAARGCVLSRMAGPLSEAPPPARPPGNTMRGNTKIGSGNTFSSMAVHKLVNEGHDRDAARAAVVAMKGDGPDPLLTPDEVDMLRATMGAEPLGDYVPPQYPSAWRPAKDYGRWNEHWGTDLPTPLPRRPPRTLLP